MLWTTQVRGSVEPTARLQLASDFRHDRGGQGEKYNRAGLSIGGIVGRVAVRASAGHWFDSPGNGRPEWGLSIAIPVKRVWFVSSAGYQDFDPTFLSAPRTSWSVGLSIPFGGKRETTSESVANGDSTRVVLRLPLREAGAAPSVAGDFNSWMPVRMTRCDHEWCFPVNLAAGVYHYAFRSNDGKWFVPPGTPNRAEDGMGGWQAVLVVQ
jgi:hypothetical protein